MMMIPIFAKFAAKGTPPNAPHVTFTCVQVACVNRLVRLRFPSSPSYIFMCSVTHGTQIYWVQCMFLDKCDDENTTRFNCTVSELSMHASVGGWFSGVFPG